MTSGLENVHQGLTADLRGRLNKLPGSLRLTGAVFRVRPGFYEASVKYMIRGRCFGFSCGFGEYDVRYQRIHPLDYVVKCLWDHVLIESLKEREHAPTTQGDDCGDECCLPTCGGVVSVHGG